MKKLFIRLIIVIVAVTLNSCGHKKNPTGGKKDTVNPEIVSIYPDEYSDITNENIEVIFSKSIERSTILSGIYIYPPILQKKYSWDGNILTIKILEKLEEDTNYYFNFSNRIKGEHGNFLNRSETYIFASGKLNSNRLSGNIFFEKESDQNKPVNITLLTSDSTMVLSKIISGTKYVLEDLNGIEHIIRAYADVNVNEKYDQANEPFFQKLIDPSCEPLQDIYLAYSDTLKPQLESANVSNNININLKFSEEVESISNIYITSNDSLSKHLEVISYFLENEDMIILTAPQDTIQYKILINDILDPKDNLTKLDSLSFDGSAKQDTIPPEILSSTPRTGSSVATVLPKFYVHFSEIIMEDKVEVNLTEIETGNKEPVVILNSNSKHYIFASQHKLNNYSSYKFELIVSDFSGNKLMKPLEIIFLPIVRDNK